MGSLLFHHKKSICCILLWGTHYIAIAQSFTSKTSLDPFSINSSGSAGKLGDLLLDWSLGESPIVASILPTSNWRLSFGFLQNDYPKNLLFSNLDSFAIQIKVGPNPFSHKLIIQCQQEGITITELHLINLSGQTLYHKRGEYAGLHYYQEINLEKTHTGTCLLTVYLCINNRNRIARTYSLLQN
jgi:hypothetical protein